MPRAFLEGTKQALEHRRPHATSWQPATREGDASRESIMIEARFTELTADSYARASAVH